MIAISQRREVVSLYVGGTKCILQDIPVVLAKANQALATLEKYRTRLDQVSTRLTALEFEGGGHAARRAHRAPALGARDADGGGDRALHRGARHRGAPDRDAARGDDGGHSRRRAGGARADRYLAAYSDEAFASALEEMGRLGHQDLLDFGRLAELLGCDRKLNTLDYHVSRASLASWGASPGYQGWWWRRSSKSSAAWTSCWRPPTRSSRRWRRSGEIRAKDIREGLRRLQEINLVDRYLQL